MATRGRRPGDQRTRDSILAAARAVFVEQGFNKATVIGIARRAEVEGALVYHYFGTKVDLFIEAAVGLPVPTIPPGSKDGHIPDGADIVATFLGTWEQGPEEPGQAFVALAQAASGSPTAARSLEEYVTQRIWGAPWKSEQNEQSLPDGPLGGEPARHAAMVGAQLVGIAWTRYILKLEPVASAPLHEVAAWFGPTIDGYRNGKAAAATIGHPTARDPIGAPAMDLTKGGDETST